MSDDSPQTTIAEGDDPPASTAHQNGEGSSDASGRLRSTIAFPYGSLKDAETIARELNDKWGGSASPDQLAGGLGQSPRSGSFRIKTGAARTFGVVSVGRGQIALTPLGRRVLDPQTRASARVEAFLAVPLFKAVYEEYKGSPLPPDQGLEQKIAALGVSEKQTAKARQSLHKSADLAGFFKHAKGRLVEPISVSTETVTSDTPKVDDQSERVKLPPTGSTSALPAPLPELWVTLLRDGASWSPEKVQEFVDAARKLHQLLGN